MQVGLIGATGYAGMELVKLLDKHPVFEIAMIGSRSYAGKKLSDLYKRPLSKDYPLLSLDIFESQLKNLDILFLSLPHGTSMEWVKKAYDLNVPVIDLSGDFRLDSKDVYEKWYNTTHSCSELLDVAIYGMPEINKEQIESASIIANPGCYPTATLLGLLPLASVINTQAGPVFVDAKSGMTGAGKKASEALLYCESNESMRPYGTAKHRHSPEIELVISKANITDDSSKILFSPSVVPMSKGILSSIYVQIDNAKWSAIMETELNSKSLEALYKSYYMDAPFVNVIDSMPETRWVQGTNHCHIKPVFDENTGCIVIHSTIDNLMKGAAGQAVHNANIRFGLDESTGL